MQAHTHLRKSLLGKAALATAALGGLLFFAGAPKAQAADRDDGDRRNARSEYRLQDHGYYGNQAREWRNEGYERQEQVRSRDNRYDERYRNDGRYGDTDRYQRRYDPDRDGFRALSHLTFLSDTSERSLRDGPVKLS